jgi:hypothetical protein
MTELLLPSSAEQINRRADRRATIRCHRHQGSGGATTYERLWARVRRISVKGIGLILSSRIEPGTPLTIEMRTKNQGNTLALLARVVHARRRKCGWLVGCEFLIRLTGEQLEELL